MRSEAPRGHNPGLMTKRVLSQLGSPQLSSGGARGWITPGLDGDHAVSSQVSPSLSLRLTQ